MNVYSEVQTFIDKYFQRAGLGRAAGERPLMVVAVSGGPDSLTLLHLLSQRELYPTHRLVVAHLDHALRPKSAQDAKFVEEIAEKWGLDFFQKRVDVGALAQASGQSIEEAGRNARYEFLYNVADNVGAPLVATGHNADDQAETLVMHFLRGTGLGGLRGMLPAGPMPGSGEQILIRPLLTIRRAAIEVYCVENDLSPLIDESNRDLSFYRNRVRKELMPLLEEFNPGLVERLGHSADLLAADHNYLNHQLALLWPQLLLDSGSSWLRLDRSSWLALPVSMKRISMRFALGKLRPDLADVGFKTIEQAVSVAELGKVGDQSLLPGPVTLTNGYEDILLDVGQVPSVSRDMPQLTGEVPLTLPVPGRIELASGWSIESSVIDEVDLTAIQANPDPWMAYLAVNGDDEIILRPRIPGEKMLPLGMAGQHVAIKEVMVNRKIPARSRARWPVVAIGKKPLWIVGHLLDERGRVKENSRNVVYIRVVPPESAESA